MFGHNAQRHIWWKPKEHNQNKHLIPKVKHAGGGVMILGLFCSHRTWGPHSHWVDCELLCIPKYSRVKFEAIHLTAKAWPKLGDSTGQWSQAHQQIYSRTTEKVKNKGVANPQSKSRPHPDWEICINKCPQTSKNLKRRVGQNWILMKSYRKWLLQVIAAKSGSTSNWIIGCP